MTVCYQIDKEKYDDLAQNGARILFDTPRYRILDGVKGDLQSHFIIDFYFDEGIFYRIDIDEAYELVAMKMVNVDINYIHEVIEGFIKKNNK